MYVPTSSSAPVATAVQSASRAKPPRERSAGLGISEFVAITTTSAMRASAVMKCTVTHQGLRSVRTTMPPTTACMRTSGNEATAGIRMSRSRRCSRTANPADASVSSITSSANARCENSMSEWIVPEGKRWPGAHPGHVVHPSPEPVPRTRPPTANSATVAAAVAIASFWNRVIRFVWGRPRSRVAGGRAVRERHGGGSRRSAAILRPMATHPTTDPAPTDAPWAVEAVRERVDEALGIFLAERRAEMASLDPAAADLIDELGRLISAGASGCGPLSASGVTSRAAEPTGSR